MYQPKQIQKKKIYDLNTIMNFGKYKPENYMGEELTVKNVMDIDPDYIDWCLSNIKWFDLSTDADDYFWNIWDGIG